MSDTESEDDALDYLDPYEVARGCENEEFLKEHAYEMLVGSWFMLPKDMKRRVSLSVKVTGFWWPILIQPDLGHATTHWAIKAGFLDNNIHSDMSMQRLKRINILESILNGVERGWLSCRLTHELIPMSANFLLSTMDLTNDAIDWLERTGEKDIRKKVRQLRPRQVCYEVLRGVFAKFSPLTTEIGGGHGPRLVLKEEISLEPCPTSKQASENLKNKGNEQYRLNQFHVAAKLYTKAIQYNPANHVLYSNRCMCYIRIGKYNKALGDGKTATVLRPDWAKGHYRYCEALYLLKERKEALRANHFAMELCKSDPEGQNDLERQRGRFLVEPYPDEKADGEGSQDPRLRILNERCDKTSGASMLKEHVLNPEAANAEAATGSGEHTGGPHTDKAEATTRPKRKTSGKSGSARKHKMKSRHLLPEDKTRSPKSTLSMSQEFSLAVRESLETMSCQQWREAKTSFSRCLDLVDKIPSQELSISELDRLILAYGYGSALLEIGQSQELEDARKQFSLLQNAYNEKLEYLYWYGLGKVLLREYRFSEALRPFSEALKRLDQLQTLGEVTWPTTEISVMETQPEKFKESLEELMNTCRFPPPPDAICKHNNPLDHTRKEIYFSDPGFKGLHRMACSERCEVEFHTTCWKKLKSDTFHERTVKDFLDKSCLTPDCLGTICHIVIFAANGNITYQVATTKQSTGKQTSKHQQSAFSKQAKAKEERKPKTSKHQSHVSTGNEQNDQDSMEDLDQRAIQEYLTSKEGSKAWFDEDHVLRQIGEMRGRFGDETHCVAAYLGALKPWMEWDVIRGTEGSASWPWPKPPGEDPLGLKDVVSLLLWRGSRVWARIFVQVLSSCNELEPKLLEWARNLDDQGVDAAKAFVERYFDPLLELDQTAMLNFRLFRESVNKKLEDVSSLGSNPMHLGHYLRRSSPKEYRFIIWVLELTREDYPLWHTMLDEFFATDCSFLVNKKAEHQASDNLTPKKTRIRKRKLKENKPVLVLSGMSTVREDPEDDLYLYDEDSFMLLDNNDPFTIPEHLQDDMAEFENWRLGPGNASYFESHVNLISDESTESLYDYFIQILRQHGPLQMDNPILLRGLHNLSQEEMNTIEAFGGLKHFLLQKSNFVMRGHIIALFEHAAELADMGAVEPNLNPLAPEFNPTSLSNGDRHSIQTGNGAYLTIQTQSHNTASINTTISQNSSNRSFSPLSSNVATSHQALSVQAGPANEPQERLVEMFGTTFSLEGKGAGMTPVSIQTRKALENASFVTSAIISSAMNSSDSFHGVHCFSGQEMSTVGDDVAVNTEAFESFEIMTGGMSKKEKDNVELKLKIPKLKKEMESDIEKRVTDLTHYQAVHEEICQQIEVLNKDISVFQQKVHEDMKTYQPEKKENQEVLRTLKSKASAMSLSNDSLLREIMSEDEKYETKCTQFKETSDLLEGEQSNLKNEAEKKKQLLLGQSNRSQLATVMMLEVTQAQDLRQLRRCLAQGTNILKCLTDLSLRSPKSDFEGLMDLWRSYVRDVEERISQTEAQHLHQMDLLRDGTSLGDLPHVPLPENPLPPHDPVLDLCPSHHLGLRHLFSSSNSQVPNRTSDLSSEQTHNPVAREPRAHQLLDKVVSSLHVRFPHFDQETLSSLTKDVLFANGGQILSLPFEEVLQRVTQSILGSPEQEARSSSERHQGRPIVHSRDQHSPASSSSGQARIPQAPSPSSFTATRSTTPPRQAWKNIAPRRQIQPKVLNMEDPCIICQDEVNPESLHVLECGHGFHYRCIHSWLNTNSSCPTCRTHIPLSQDFPVLLGRADRPV